MACNSEWMSEQLKMNNTNWNLVSDRLKMNEWKLLGNPSMNTVQNCSDWAAEKAELRASVSKMERRRASEPMPWCKRRIPSSTHVTENTANEREEMKSWQHKKEEPSFAAQISWSATKIEILNEVTKWGQDQQEEICWQKWETVMMRCFNKCIMQ